MQIGTSGARPLCHSVVVPLPVGDVLTQLERLTQAAISVWQRAPRDGAPRQVNAVLRRVASAKPGSSDAVDAAEELAGLVLPAHEAGAPWCDDSLGTLVLGLISVVRQYRYSPAAKKVLLLCEEISAAASAQPLDLGVQTSLVAGLMLVEDATCAVEGYRAQPPFQQVDAAYLAKFGLLQALQLGFDGAERVCRTCGVKARADRSDEGKAVKITRTIVAGHPLGGNLASRRWYHFHDRQSAQDKDILRVMSFLEDDPEIWTGQSQSTTELMSNGLDVMAEILGQARACFPDPIPNGVTGLLFPEHDFGKRYVDSSLG